MRRESCLRYDILSCNKRVCTWYVLTVFVICANVNWVRMDFESLVARTVFMVESGLPDSTINRADANKPKDELTCSSDLEVSDSHVHRFIVRADRPTTMF